MQESVHTVTKPIGFCCECRKISRGHKIKLVSGDFPVCDVRTRSITLRALFDARSLINDDELGLPRRARRVAESRAR